MILTHLQKFEDIFIYNDSTFDEIYQYAADMGGAGYIFSGDNDANVMTNSSLINLNVLTTMTKLNLSMESNKSKKVFMPVQPAFIQVQPIRS